MSFQFREFYLKDDNCAMKVSTDAILLGSWVALPSTDAPLRCLDLGTGSGILALMLAQRQAQQLRPFMIDALELEHTAYQDARENVADSVWAEHIHVYQTDVRQWQGGPYQLLVSNPPYFNQSLRASHSARAVARQGQNENIEAWLDIAQAWLEPTGRYNLMLPRALITDAKITQWRQLGWYLTRHCQVRSQPTKSPYLSLLELARQPVEACEQTELEIFARGESRAYSAAFKKLTADFYLAGREWDKALSES